MVNTRTPTWLSCATTAPRPLDGEHAHAHVGIVRDDGAATRSTANTRTPTWASCATTAPRLARRQTRARPRGHRARRRRRDSLDREHAHAHAGIVRDDGAAIRSTANTRTLTRASCATTAPRLPRRRTRARSRGRRARQRRGDSLDGEHAHAHAGVVRDDGAPTPRREHAPQQLARVSLPSRRCSATPSRATRSPKAPRDQRSTTGGTRSHQEMGMMGVLTLSP